MICAFYAHPEELVHIGLYDSEDQAWRVFLGWPTREEINQAKKRLTCKIVEIREIPKDV